jgi:transposase
MEQENFNLDSKYVGVLPIVNHFLQRLGFARLLAKYLPPCDKRTKMNPAHALEVLVRNIIICRTPLYSVGEWAQQIVPSLLCMGSDQIPLLNDDRVGRALDRLFEADRTAMVTDLVVHMVGEFEIDLKQFHNDSTTLTLHGEYLAANGHIERGKPTVVATFGHNKDHRPDLKQLLWILTVSEDGAVPVQFKVADGNTEDSTTHIETWEVLRRLVGNAQFLYIADSKLCTRENLHHIAEAHGQFITVLPRSRKEDGLFKEWLVNHTPDWQEIVQYPHPRRKDGPPDIVRALESPIPDTDGYRLIWYHSSHKRERDARNRQDRILRAYKELDGLKAKLDGPRCRYATREGVDRAVKKILSESGAEAWVGCEIQEWQKKSYRQEKRGRPGDDTRWRRKVKQCFRLSWEPNEESIQASVISDGIFPLLTNRSDLPFLDILACYKSKQPFVEKRHELLKNTLEVTPVFLKSISRLEAFLFLAYVGVTVHALMERALRKAMQDKKIKSLPLYPEARKCTAPTMARIIDVFGNLQRHILSSGGKIAQRFDPELTKLQKEIVKLLGVSPRSFAVDT